MKAIILNKTGSLSHLKLANIPSQVIQNGEELVRVEYCGVNHLDLLIIEGKRPTSNKFPLVLGSEIVGRNTKTGEKVAIYPWSYCGLCPQCKSGNENICNEGGTFGRTRPGGFAEYIAVPKKNIVRLPEKTNGKLICASTLSAITALHMIKRAKIPDQATVLINGATGGVGTAAIQILKHKKCRVYATTTHKEKIKKLTNLGAIVVDKMPDKIPYVLDVMGGDIWSKSIEKLVKNGTLVFCATTLDDPGSVNIGSAFNRQINILGSYGGTIGDLREVIEMVNRGVIKPVIDSIYKLEDVPLALKKLQDQKAFGKILIRI